MTILKSSSLFFPLVMLLATAAAAEPEALALAQAGRAVRQAEAANPRGEAGQWLASAQSDLALAIEAQSKRRAREALALARRAETEADLAFAMARQSALAAAVEAKNARNVDLRRQLLLGGEQP